MEITGYPSAQVTAYGFPVVGVLFLSEAYNIFPKIRAPHLLIDMIPTNNAQYHDVERASVGHFTHEASRGGWWLGTQMRD